MKRRDFIGWDEYFMGIALLSAQRSKDSNTQVGACIVGAGQRIVSVGYNGMPTGCDDDAMPWEREGDFLDTKYPYVCHAELNAILNSPRSVRGCTLYVTLFPCNECAKAIIQSGISEIVYLENKYKGTKEILASERLFSMVGIQCIPYEAKGRSLELAL